MEFLETRMESKVITKSYQQINIKFLHNSMLKEIWITRVYARCSSIERLELWDDLESNSLNINKP